MQRQISWVQRQDDGIKREVRVTVQRNQIKWQYKSSAEEKWDYTTPPTPAEWDDLLERVENRYQRRNCPHADLLLVRRLHDQERKTS